jgi:hypothetical protein
MRADDSDIGVIFLVKAALIQYTVNTEYLTISWLKRKVYCKKQGHEVEVVVLMDDVD